MRVISGRFKGRKLGSFQAGHIRPTTDRVKESLFNILRNDIEGARVLDLFSGTGSLAIEALSREATRVVAVELNSKSIQIIKENLKSLGVEPEVELIKQDVFRFLEKYQGDSFDVILVDPPFTDVLAHKVLQALPRSKVLGTKSIIAIESAKKEKIEDNYDSLHLFDRRAFGDKILSLYSPIDNL